MGINKNCCKFLCQKLKLLQVFVFYYIYHTYRFFFLMIYVRIKFKTEHLSFSFLHYFLNICLSLNLYIATTVSLQNVLRTFDVRNTEFVRVLYQRKHFFGCAMRHFLYSSIRYLGTIQTCFI